jgi:hypothetical protein
MYVDVKSKETKQKVSDEPTLDWRAVLYHGDAKSAVPLSALHAEEDEVLV